jgi:hypothetical protein
MPALTRFSVGCFDWFLSLFSLYLDESLVFALSVLALDSLWTCPFSALHLIQRVPFSAQNHPRFCFRLDIAIATTDNGAARAAVQAVAAQRRLVVQAGRPRNVTQRIRFVAWDQADWYRQMVTAAHGQQQAGVMDHVCGAPGYQAQYEDAVRQFEQARANNNNDNDQKQQRISEWAATTLVTACLLRTGNGDGYVARTLHVTSPMARGVSGVAAVVLDTHRVHDDVLWLPILSRQELLDRSGSRSVHDGTPFEPSTRLPHQMADALLAILRNATLYAWNHTRVVTQWQEFLYTIIVAENQQAAAQGQSRLPWTLLTAACRADDRARLARTQRLIATNCAVPPPNTTSTLHIFSGGAEYSGPADQECCAFFDPERKPFVICATESRR